MEKVYSVGVIGCGDYARGQSKNAMASSRIKLVKAYDPNKETLDRYCSMFGASAVSSEDDIFNDPSIEIVLLFTPPWIRKAGIEKAAASSKHIITTKPLAPNIDEAMEIYKLTKNVNCSVFYRRTDDTSIDALKSLFDSGEVGNLALYKEEWYHHYPSWNNWATDPDKNGGPFMDAMIHNLNIARYLMGEEPSELAYFSDNHAQSLRCSDTEFMKLNFGKTRSAYLFITWAADLAVHSTDGNDREHIGVCRMITDKGYYVESGWSDGGRVITASKDGIVKTWKVSTPKETAYDNFVSTLEKNEEQKFDVIHALRDIKILDEAVKNKNNLIKIDVESFDR